MTFSTTVTERDKRLLYGLGLVLFVVLFFYFALRPAFSWYQNTGDALLLAKEQQQEMELQIAQSGANAALAADAKAQLDNAAANQLLHLLTNDEIDAFVTGLTLEHGLSPVSLQITAAAPVQLEPYIASDEALLAAADAAAATADADAAPGSVSSADASAALAQVDAANYVQTAFTTGTATGTRAQFRAFLTDIAANYPAVRLVSFAVQDTSYLNGDSDVETISQFTYTLALSMCENAEGSL